MPQPKVTAVINPISPAHFPHTGAPTSEVATLLSALHQAAKATGAKGSAAHSLQLLSHTASTVCASAHGLLRTAAQEGMPASVITHQAADPHTGLALSSAAAPCLAFTLPPTLEHTSSAPSTDVYGAAVSGAAVSVQAVPRLVACPAAQQADAFAPYKLLPLPRRV